MAAKKKSNSGGSSNSGKKPAASRKGAPNTRRHVYIDTPAAKRACAQDLAAIEKKCAPENHADKERRQKQAPGLLGKLKLPGHGGTAANPEAQWINDHCEFLMIKPTSPDDMFNELESLPSKMAEELGVKALEAVEAKAREKLDQAIKKKLAKTALKQLLIRGGSFLGGPWVGIPVNILMSADAANDLANAAKEFPDLLSEIEQAANKIKEAKAQIANIQGQLDKYKNADGTYNKQKMVSVMMTAAAKMNPCIKARRCELVPFKETENPTAAAGFGCCPGQTGHHVLPGAMFEGCTNYKHADAPTICVEGTNNSHGSHGAMHDSLENILKIRRFPPGAPISLPDAVDTGVLSVTDVFPESGCNPACIEAQLKSYYGKLGCNPNSSSGKGGQKSGGKAGAKAPSSVSTKKKVS